MSESEIVSSALIPWGSYVYRLFVRKDFRPRRWSDFFGLFTNSAKTDIFLPNFSFSIHIRRPTGSRANFVINFYKHSPRWNHNYNIFLKTYFDFNQSSIHSNKYFSSNSISNLVNNKRYSSLNVFIR